MSVLNSWDDLEIGSLISDKQLIVNNTYIRDNSLIAEPTGRTAADGSPEYILKAKTGQNAAAAGVCLRDTAGLNALMAIFGDQIITQRVPVIASQFFFGVSARDSNITIEGSGSAAIEGEAGYENLLGIHTGTTAGSKVVIESAERTRYIPGQQFGNLFTVLFPSPPTASDGYAIAGQYDDLDGFWVGNWPDGGAPVQGLGRRRNGIDYFIPRTAFNRDKLDGTGPSGIVIDDLTGNIIHIRGVYLGFGPIIFEIVQPTGPIVPFHVIEYPNSAAHTHISNTRLPARAEVYNGSAAEDVHLQVGSIQLYVLDGANSDVNTRKFANGLAGSVTPTTPIPKMWVAYRNKSTYQGALQPTAKPNNVPTNVTLLNMTLNGQNQDGLIEVFVLDDDDILAEGTWTDEGPDSVVAYSTDVQYEPAAFSNNKPVFSVGFNKNESFSFTEDVEKYFPELRPTQHRVYTILSNSQAIDYTHSIAWKEKF